MTNTELAARKLMGCMLTQLDQRYNWIKQVDDYVEGHRPSGDTNLDDVTYLYWAKYREERILEYRALLDYINDVLTTTAECVMCIPLKVQRDSYGTHVLVRKEDEG